MKAFRKACALALALALVLSLSGMAMGEEPAVPETPPVTQSPDIPEEPDIPTEPEKIELTMIWDYDIVAKGRVLPVGDSEAWDEEIEFWNLFLSSVAAYNENEDEALLTLETLDTSGVDILTPGDYAVTVVLKLTDEYAEDFTIADEVRTLHIPVFICDPKKFNIRMVGVTQTKFEFQLITELDEEPSVLWVESEQQLEEDALESADWQPCPGSVALSGKGIGRISRDGLTLNRHYYFRLKSGERYSDIIHIMDDGTIPSYGYVGGDRDGGDSGGSKPPDIVLPPPTQQPPATGDGGSGGSSGGVTQKPRPTPSPTPTPTPTSTPSQTPTPTPPPESTYIHTPEPTLSPEPSPEVTSTVSATPAPSATPPSVPAVAPAPKPSATPFAEEFGETYSRLSGARLRLMAEEDGAVRFSKQGVAVTLSGETVEALAVPEDGLFSIEITRPDDHTFSLAVSVDGLSADALPNTDITLPYMVADGASILTLQDESGQAVSTGSYDAERQLAGFTVDAAGSYTIVEESVPVMAIPAATAVPTQAPAETPAPQPPATVGVPTALITLAGACLLLLIGGGFFLWNRRRGE